MPRYFINFAYNGTSFHGWQRQPHDISVQEVLEESLATILRQPIELIGAGRTDAGVHAKQMYAHFDIDKLPKIDLVKKMNSLLPHAIAVFDFIKVNDNAHARFDATSRTYEYHLHTQKDPFLNSNSFYFSQKLNIEKMNEAANILLAYEDFECFSKTHTDVNTFLCNITEAFWQKDSHRLIFTISANRFLRNMVRAIVGTLLDVGIEKTPIDQIHKIVASKNRAEAGFSVPAHGLYLTQIKYPYL